MMYKKKMLKVSFGCIKFCIKKMFMALVHLCLCGFLSWPSTKLTIYAMFVHGCSCVGDLHGHCFH